MSGCGDLVIALNLKRGVAHAFRAVDFDDPL